MRAKESIDASGEPVPWYTYPAIEYLKQMDLKDKTIFEYGAGGSTRFFAKRCRRLVSVEDDKSWYDKVNALLPTNAKCQYIKERLEYVNYLNTVTDKIDIIAIDGKYRMACAKESVKRIADDGFIILDNSDHNQKTSAFLRSEGLIEVDMSGFTPINGFTCVTSFFFKRGVQLKPLYEKHPMCPIGGIEVEEAVE